MNNVYNADISGSFIHRGDICLVDFKKNEGSEQSGIRPALILQNNIGNHYSPITIVCPITSNIKKYQATHVKISPEECGVLKESIVLCEQIRAIDKSRIRRKVGRIIQPQILSDIEMKTRFLLGL